jgi:hypothetical protein
VIRQRGPAEHHLEDFVHIRLISSMTNDDESRFATVLLKAMDELLSKLPVVYHVRIDTSTGRVFQRSRVITDPAYEEQNGTAL